VGYVCSNFHQPRVLSENLRAMKIFLFLLGLSLAVNAANLLPNGSFEHGADLAWNRMHDLPYLPDPGWKQDAIIHLDDFTMKRLP